MLRAATLVAAALALATILHYAFSVNRADAVPGWITMRSSFTLPPTFQTPRLAPTLLVVALKVLVAGVLAVTFPLTSSLAPVAGLTYQFWRQLSTGGAAGPHLPSPHNNPLNPLHLAIQFAVAGAVAHCVASSRRHDRRRHRRRGITLWSRVRSFRVKTVRAVTGGVACVLRALYRSVERFLVRADPYLRAMEDRYPANEEADDVLLDDDGPDDDDASSEEDSEEDEEYVDDEDSDEEYEEEVAEVVIRRGGRALVGNDPGWVLRRYVVELQEEGDDDEGDGEAGQNDADGVAQHGADPPQHRNPPDGPPEGGDEAHPREEGGTGADNVEEILVDDSDDEQGS